MSDKRKGQRSPRQIAVALPLTATDRLPNFQKGAAMLEAEVTADMLLMTQPFKAAEPSLANIAAEPVAAQLVKAVLAGQRERFAALYEMYGPMGHGILLATEPRGEVDELVQDI